MSQLGMSTLSRSNCCKIILALKDHSLVESCCIKLLYDCEKMLLILEILDAIDFRVLKLGVHRQRVFTARGWKQHSAATTWTLWWLSFEASAASAAAPALLAALVMKTGRRLFSYHHVRKAWSSLTEVTTWAVTNTSRTVLLSIDMLSVSSAW